ncbi:MAG: hypothetical protein ACRDL6_02140 [Solirubrobacterales bacterium]
MSAIRPLERDDLPAVAALYELGMRSGERRVRPETVSFFERTLFDHPWHDPELPSLVHLGRSGSIIAFLGSHVRRLRFDGEPLRLACSGQLVADPEAENRAAGALLLARYLKGPQDLTTTDGATPAVLRIWERLGGRPFALACIGWTRVFRPLQFLAERRGARRGRDAPGAIARGPFAGLDWVAAHTRPSLLIPPESSASVEPLTPAGLLERLEELGAHFRLRPDYDLEWLEWVFGELDRVTGRGELVAQAVQGPRGRVSGWYVYYLRPGHRSVVIQLVARRQDADLVIGHLFSHAQRGGAAALSGRLEPPLLEPLGRRRCIFRYTGEALVHSRREDVLGAIASPQGLLTRLEGEWWMAPHLG